MFETWTEWYTDRNDLFREYLKRSTIETLAVNHAMGANAKDLEWGVLRSVQIGTMFSLRPEDTDTESMWDPLHGAVFNIAADWARTAALTLDNLCLGLTEPFVTSEGTTPKVTSLYLSTQNRFRVSDLETVKGLVPALADYVAEEPRDGAILGSRPGIIAHPAFRRTLFPGGIEGKPTVAGLPVKWTTAACTSETMTSRPTGNKLLFIGDMDDLHLGTASGPRDSISVYNTPEELEMARMPSGSGLGSGLLKIKMMRSFAVDPSNRFQCVELAE